MVEIKRGPFPLSQGDGAKLQEDLIEDAKHRLLYSKSRVYVHPTPYSRDNIPGFVALVKREATSPTYLLAWIPESLLDGRADWDTFVRVEKTSFAHDEDADGVLIEPPAPHGQSYAFSVPLTSIYSLMVSLPSMSSWYGSTTINLINGSTLPTLYHHDDESRSLEHDQRVSPNGPSWGGEALLQKLRQYAHLLRSNLQQGLFLVDPSKADIEAHSTLLFDDDAVDLIFSHSTLSSPIPQFRRPHPPPLPSQYPPSAPLSTQSNRNSLLHQGLASASSTVNGGPRQAILSSFSQITRATRHAAQNILSHPLAKPILPHLPEPVKSFANAQGEWSSWVEKGGVGEFESARVYLAKWARVVAEEGERARQSEVYGIPRNATHDEETSDLGVFELLTANASLPIPKATRTPRNPIDLETWNSWFAGDGRPKITFDEFRGQVFRRGFVYEARRKAWPYLLEVFPWNATHEERDSVLEGKGRIYADIKKEWESNAEVFNRDDVVEERHRIDVDCRRTDRTHPLFAIDEEAVVSVSTLRLEETGAQSLANEHVNRLAVILLTYNFYERELGYVQGMSDLCSPIYVVCGADEVTTFWCFVSVMERMKQNFLRDQSGMKKQLSMLQQLVAMMDPELYRHLEKTDSLNLFFCFRWVLIVFKREFPFEDVLRLWEVLWTDFYTKRFVLFVALAVLESHRDVILRYLVEFDEVLKYCNELSMSIELDSTLAQAEVLFLSFSQIIADVDRRRAEHASQHASTREASLRRRTGAEQVSEDAPKKSDVRVREILPIISDDMRELLTA
ncbi:rab-GTPase-TBC domain-containing protein [Cantharellus anzutake]|uniref:rab-GTPase-TBC domain-containing protein n=1 Tax=Cantharellus anzutake TaxID=1750568 RepID=UPI001905FEC9|nr:rab-GTPase-TBC domain-containing protein [Cantharellus anzutake]KAF8326026.1 rab-GTPase-TBC domain-containing protein [Cantharellus anzutake]